MQIRNRWLALRSVAGALSLAAALPALAQPANDACTAAAPITLGNAVNGTTVGAGVDISVTCQSDTADVWYSFEPQTFASYAFRASGESNANLSLALISGCEFPIGEFACAVGGIDGPGFEVLLFPGSPVLVRVGSTLGQTFTLEVDLAPPPANDECAGAVPLSLGTPVSANNFSATTTLELDDATLCHSIAPGVGGGADLFFSFTPAQDGYYDFSTCGAELDTVVSVHSGCPVSAANAIACNDNAPLNACEGPFDTYSSYVAGVQMTAGVTYYIRVAGVRFVDHETGELGEPGRGNFTITAFSGFPPVTPANDECAAAEEIFADNAVFGSTVNATSSVAGTCGFDDVWDVWYTFTSAAFDRRAFRFEVSQGSFGSSATLTAYDACGGEVLACYASNPLTSPDMVLFVNVDPGQTITLRVAGQGGTQDEFMLVTTTGSTGADNVTCETAQVIGVNQTVVADTTGANSGEPSPCGFDDYSALWYSFTAPSNGYFRFATDFVADPKSFQRSSLAVYEACGAEAVACTIHGDNFSTNPSAAALALNLDAGETRFIRVGHLYPHRGPMDFSVSGPLPPPPPVTNDTCAQARVITSMPFQAQVDVTLATPDQDVCAFNGEPPVPTPGGIWYRFTPEVDRVFRATVSAGDALNARATVFSGSCGSLTQVACPNGFGGDPGILLSAGVTYSILVSLDEGRGGGPIGEVPYGTTLDIEFIALPRPDNDHCSTAQRVTSSDAVITVNTLAADPDSPQPSCIGQDGVLNNAVWYTFTPTSPGTLTVHGEAQPGFYSPGGVLYSGSCGELTEVACDSPVNGFFLTFMFDFTAELQAGETYYMAVGAWAAPIGDETQITISYTGDLGCPADFNGDGQANSQDFFDFLTAFFAQDPSADFNNDAQVNSQDFFDFLQAFFNGCP